MQDLPKAVAGKVAGFLTDKDLVAVGKTGRTGREIFGENQVAWREKFKSVFPNQPEPMDKDYKSTFIGSMNAENYIGENIPSVFILDVYDDFVIHMKSRTLLQGSPVSTDRFSFKNGIIIMGEEYSSATISGDFLTSVTNNIVQVENLVTGSVTETEEVKFKVRIPRPIHIDGTHRFMVAEKIIDRVSTICVIFDTVTGKEVVDLWSTYRMYKSTVIEEYIEAIDGKIYVYDLSQESFVVDVGATSNEDLKRVLEQGNIKTCNTFVVLNRNNGNMYKHKGNYRITDNKIVSKSGAVVMELGTVVGSDTSLIVSKIDNSVYIRDFSLKGIQDVHGIEVYIPENLVTTGKYTCFQSEIFLEHTELMKTQIQKGYTIVIMGDSLRSNPENSIWFSAGTTANILKPIIGDNFISMASMHKRYNMPSVRMWQVLESIHKSVDTLFVGYVHKNILEFVDIVDVQMYNISTGPNWEVVDVNKELSAQPL
jgi:hypothetical protein